MIKNKAIDHCFQLSEMTS